MHIYIHFIFKLLIIDVIFADHKNYRQLLLSFKRNEKTAVNETKPLSFPTELAPVYPQTIN